MADIIVIMMHIHQVIIVVIFMLVFMAIQFAHMHKVGGVLRSN